MAGAQTIDTTALLIAAISAVVTVAGSVLAAYGLIRREMLALSAARMTAENQLETARMGIASDAGLRDANTSKIMGETLRSVVTDLRNEINARDEAHAREIDQRDAQWEREREEMRAQLEALSARLEDAMAGIMQLQEQVRQLGGSPIYPAG